MSFSFDLRRKTVDSRDLFQRGVYPPEFNEEFKEGIRKRDKRRCALCPKTEKKLGHHLDVHHLNYTKYTVRVNCISLCRECHNLVHSSKDRKFRSEWAGKLYQITLKREGCKTREDIIKAWRKPDE